MQYVFKYDILFWGCNIQTITKRIKKRFTLDGKPLGQALIFKSKAYFQLFNRIVFYECTLCQTIPLP